MAKHPQEALQETAEYKIALIELREICDSNGLSMGKITLSQNHAQVYEALCEEQGIESTAEPQGKVLLVECAQLRELFGIDEDRLKIEATGLDLRVERPTTKEEAFASTERRRRDTVSNSTRIANSSPMPQEDDGNEGKMVMADGEVVDPDDLGDESGPGTASKDDDGESPVANLTATEAKDKIGRMTSEENLQAIVDYDTRSTVSAAAKARLEELRA